MNTIINELDFLRKTVVFQWNPWKENIYICFQKVPDSRNPKEYYKSFLRKKNRKSVNQSEIITYKPKTFDTVDIESDIKEHPKNFKQIT